MIVGETSPESGAAAAGQPLASPARKPVPAVRHVVAIFEFMRSARNEPQTLSEISRGLGINLSTCFNILKTLEAGHLMSFDPVSKTYGLGFGLRPLGALVDVARQRQELVLDEARHVSESVGLGCFLMTLTEREEFVVLDKVESREPIRITIDVGATFPVTGAVAAKAWFAWNPDHLLPYLAADNPLPAYTAHSITAVKDFEAELALTRERGYSTSISEYYPDHNAVAASVYGRDAGPEFLLVVVGATSRLSGAVMTEVGQKVAASARRGTTRIGGRQPGGGAAR